VLARRHGDGCGAGNAVVGTNHDADAVFGHDASCDLNPANGNEEDIGTPWIWCLLFGCIYFAVRGVWTHAVAALLLAVITAGFSWLVYPFFARAAVERHYFRKGWLPVSR
jgi:hypothetical protein